MNFPVFRKYPQGQSYFKIESVYKFIEIKLWGNRKEEHGFEAKILPDRVLIQDMIDMKDGHWTACSEEEFEAVKSR